MTDNTRNMILAVVLSLAVLFGMAVFIAGPQMERAQRQAQIAAQQQAARYFGAGDAVDGTRNRTRPPGPQRAARTPAADEGRIAYIDRAGPRSQPARACRSTAPALNGSINLTGARLDDLTAQDIHRDRRPDLPDHHPASALGSAGWLLRRRGLGAGRRRQRQGARRDHRVDARPATTRR